MSPTKEQLVDTEVALTNWWCGTDFSAMTEDGTEYTDDAIRGSQLLTEYSAETLELLTWWRGYMDASLEETSMQPTVEDFILATYVVNKESYK